VVCVGELLIVAYVKLKCKVLDFTLVLVVLMMLMMLKVVVVVVVVAEVL
jgi:hypothetical protein